MLLVSYEKYFNCWRWIGNSRYLKAEGLDVHWLSLGTAAIELIAAKHFDLVILDVGLPDINGFEVCKEIRAFIGQ